MQNSVIVKLESNKNLSEKKQVCVFHPHRWSCDFNMKMLFSFWLMLLSKLTSSLSPSLSLTHTFTSFQFSQTGWHSGYQPSDSKLCQTYSWNNQTFSLPLWIRSSFVLWQLQNGWERVIYSSVPKACWCLPGFCGHCCWGQFVFLS